MSSREKASQSNHQKGACLSVVAVIISIFMGGAQAWANQPDCNPFLTLTAERVADTFLKALPKLSANPDYVRPNIWFFPSGADFLSRTNLKEANGNESSGFLRMEFGTYSPGGIETAYRSAVDHRLVPMETQLKKIELDILVESEDRPPGQTWKLVPYSGKHLSEGEVKFGDVVVLMHPSQDPESPGVVFMCYIVVHVVRDILGDPSSGDWAQHGNVRWTVSGYHFSRAVHDAKAQGLKLPNDYFDLVDQESEKLYPFVLRDLKRSRDY